MFDSPSLHLIVGPHGVGKSRLASQILVANALGEDFLGQSCKASSLVHLSPSNEPELASEAALIRCERLVEPFDERDDPYFLSSGDMVVVDPACLFLPHHDPDSSQVVGKFLRGLLERHRGVTFVLVHSLDLNKNGPPRSQVAGCSLWSEMADEIVIVDWPSPFESPESNERTVTIYRRDQAPVVLDTVINSSSQFELKR